GVQVEADLGNRMMLLDVVENLANLFTVTDRLGPAGFQFKESAVRRYDSSITRPFIDAIDTIHGDGRGIDLNSNQVAGQRLAVKEFKVGFFPNEQVVNNFERARAQHFHNVSLADKPTLSQDIAQPDTCLPVNVHSNFQLGFIDLAVMQQHLADEFFGIV